MVLSEKLKIKVYAKSECIVPPSLVKFMSNELLIASIALFSQVYFSLYIRRNQMTPFPLRNIVVTVNL